MGIVEIILIIIGSGGLTGLITWAVTVKAQKKRENAVALREEALAEQEEVRARFDLSEFENQVFERVLNRVENESKVKDDIIEKQGKEITQLKENQSNIMKANEILMGRVEYLEQELDVHKSMVSDYKETCDKCQFRLDNKIKK
jgi:hypothetical protein